MLESLQHADNSFVTLTYDDDRLPADGSLNPVHSRNWIKSLRKAVAPAKLRFFLVGEYGDETFRPHYHAALFGYPPCSGVTPCASETRACPVCALVRKTWKHGHVLVGRLELESVQYICGYVVKKMTNDADPRLGGRHPEFARMSRMPGIGASAMWEVSSILNQYDVVGDDVPDSLSHGRRSLPLGRYLKSRLREMVGRDAKTPSKVLQKFSDEMHALRLDYEALKKAGKINKYDVRFSQYASSLDDQRYLNMEKRREIFKKRRSL